MSDNVSEPALRVSGLRVSFSRGDQRVAAVNGVKLTLERGEILTVLGESGSGKSVMLRAIMGLLPHHARVEGNVQFRGTSLYDLPPEQRLRLRGPVVSMIYQEPMSSIDPVFSIGDQMTEMIMAHEPVDRQEARKRALELLEMVSIPSAKSRMNNFAHEMSGGMRQRAMIALALSCRPSVLLADEPTTALDVTVQMQILLLIRRLRDLLGMAVVFVTHDIGVAAEISDRVAVMYAGTFVETGSACEVLLERRHPYTEGLLSSSVSGRLRGASLKMIPGQPPDLSALPKGCAFLPRCGRSTETCGLAQPESQQLSIGRKVACYNIIES